MCNLLEERRDRGEILHIMRIGPRRSQAGPIDRGSDTFQLVGASRDQRHLRARTRERLRQSLPDSRRSSNNDGVLPLCHAFPN